jgi:hypothetical protein
MASQSQLVQIELGVAVRQPKPDWLKARAETEKNGQIVASITNTLLAPTSFSSVK